MVLSFAKAYREALAAQKQLTNDLEPSKVPVSEKVSVGEPVRQTQPKKIEQKAPRIPAAALRRSPPRYIPPVSFRQQPVRHAPVVQPGIKMAITGTCRMGWRPDDTARLLPKTFPLKLGCKLQLANDDSHETRELVLGLDFGTSCAKVVIDDRQMQQRYAVPLVDAAGVNAYLLPARLNENLGAYTLEDEGVAFTDLKLALMASPDDEKICARVCAFLALVIRSSRAWLFTEHHDAFLKANILWTLALGQPADQATSKHSKDLFENLGRVAWSLASYQRVITPEKALSQWRSRAQLVGGDDLEIVVMPEMAAQIHGFVSSHGFDQRGANIFLMVDVGAGTLDASIFHVKKDPSGSVSFSFFTNSVEAYGAANLHRFRVGWWQKQLSAEPKAKKLVAELEEIRLPTEYRGRFPEKFDDYVKGVSVSFVGGEENPDQQFFRKVRGQVAGGVMYKAYKDNLLSTSAIKGIPFFLCGGGGRHELYKKLEEELRHTPGASWMNAQRHELTLPPDLIAPGVKREDYDRLSVAYGLSRLIPGQVRNAAPLLPKVDIPKSSDWRSNYIDK